MSCVVSSSLFEVWKSPLRGRGKVRTTTEPDMSP